MMSDGTRYRDYVKSLSNWGNHTFYTSRINSTNETGISGKVCCDKILGRDLFLIPRRVVGIWDSLQLEFIYGGMYNQT